MNESGTHTYTMLTKEEKQGKGKTRDDFQKILWKINKTGY